MKIQYLSTLAVVSLLSISTMAGCSSPAQNDASTSPSTAVQADAKANPCAAKANPCAAKANPCAAKANPCAAKANPCAAKASTASVGGPLAQKLQGKPVVVDIYASWCPACKNIAPTVAQLKEQYAGKVEFVVLDVSDKSTTAAAEATAQELGLSKFLAENKAQTGSLAIVDPATGNILAQYRNNPDKTVYTQVLDKALTK
ncbi:MAG: thioredoxin family protein [Coleofasciculaceae cyanobacterium SM2_1_6]|nr:thioredoxin family protein [Coleofasciculaceae cyanobacterium SM2_1_6]